MTFSIEKERLTAVTADSRPAGFVSFPRVKAGLVNIDRVVVSPDFRGQGVENAMLDALFAHLTESGVKAALTAPVAQQYVADNPQWKRILPGDIHFTTY